ncbi:MAG: O-antigen ligase family protein, partial [Longimicrobiales bacterium]
LDILPWGQTLLILCIVAFLLEGKTFKLRTPAGPLLVLFTVIVLASSVLAYSPRLAFNNLELYLSWVLIYLLITNIVTTEQRFFIFFLSFLLYSFKMSQHGARSWAMRGFSFADWGVTGAPGWFHNSGEVGIQMCVFFPLALGFYIALKGHWGKWRKLFFVLFPVTAVMTMIASSSRGALLGGGLVLLWIVLRSRYRVKALVGAAVVTIAVVAFVPDEFKERFSTMGEDKTSESRLVVWRYGMETAKQHPVLGIGYKNWSHYATRTYGRPLLPHNIFVEAAAELGYIGLLGFLLLIGATFWVNANTRKIVRRIPGDQHFLYQIAHGLDGALIGYMASGFFITVLFYPYFWINLAMAVALNTAASNKARTASQVMAAAATEPLVSPPADLANDGRLRGGRGRLLLGQRGGAVLGPRGPRE